MVSLPPHLDAFREEIEFMAGTKITWEQVDSLGGDMSSTIRRGRPEIQYRQFSEAGAAEELLHLKLDFSGMPRLVGPENMLLAGQAAGMLENIFHHHLIYPQLEGMGYAPRTKECHGIGKQLDKVEQTDLSRTADEPNLRALFAMVYARSQLDCDSAATTSRADTIFSCLELQRSREMGQQVAVLINSHEGVDLAKCKQTLHRCLSTLGLTGIVGIVEYPASIKL